MSLDIYGGGVVRHDQETGRPATPLRDSRQHLMINRLYGTHLVINGTSVSRFVLSFDVDYY